MYEMLKIYNNKSFKWLIAVTNIRRKNMEKRCMFHLLKEYLFWQRCNWAFKCNNYIDIQVLNRSSTNTITNAKASTPQSRGSISKPPGVESGGGVQPFRGVNKIMFWIAVYQLSL